MYLKGQSWWNHTRNKINNSSTIRLNILSPCESLRSILECNFALYNPHHFPWNCTWMHANDLKSTFASVIAWCQLAVSHYHSPSLYLWFWLGYCENVSERPSPHAIFSVSNFMSVIYEPVMMGSWWWRRTFVNPVISRSEISLVHCATFMCGYWCMGNYKQFSYLSCN